MHRIGMGLIEEKRAEILAEKTTSAGSSSSTDGRDILSVLSKRHVCWMCRVKLIGYLRFSSLKLIVRSCSTFVYQ